VCLSKVERSKGKIKPSEIEWKVADLRGGKASAGAGTRCDDAAPRHTHRTQVCALALRRAAAAGVLISLMRPLLLLLLRHAVPSVN
jgi:hypothetical protein